MSTTDLGQLILDNDVAAVHAFLGEPEAKEHLNSICNNKGEYPIHVATIGGSPKMVEALLKAGCYPNQGSEEKGSHNGYTAAHIAAGNGDTEILELLARHKADFNLPATDRWYPLHLAAYKSKMASMETLLENGAEVNCENNYGQTPLVFSATHGRVSDVRFLLKKGATTMIKDPNGDSIMHHALFYQMSKMFEGTYEVAEAQLDVAVALILGGAEPDLNNNEGKEAAYYFKEELPSLPLAMKLLSAHASKLLRSPIQWNFMTLVSALPSNFTSVGVEEAAAVELCEAMQTLNKERLAMRQKRETSSPAGGCPVMHEKKNDDHAAALADVPPGSDPSGGKCPFFSKNKGGKTEVLLPDGHPSVGSEALGAEGGADPSGGKCPFFQKKGETADGVAAAVAVDKPLCPFSMGFLVRHQQTIMLMCASFILGIWANQIVSRYM